MNKSAIKTFAVETRKKLIADISYQASLYGITEAGVTPAQRLSEGVQSISLGKAGQKTITGAEITQREALANAIEQKAKELPYKEAYQYIIEEVAYTWFNRLIALRFMEVNDYMPSHIRVLSSEKQGKKEPDCVTAPFDMRWQYTAAEEARIEQLKNDNKLDELFRMLFLKQCDELAGILPYLFKMDSPETQLYSALLLNISYIDKDGVIRHLVDDIPEADWQDQVQIIGWLYQYYNTEPKEKVFANLKKNVKISKENIPAATQLFTPDWIVRYMVENSLGRIFINNSQKSVVSSQKLADNSEKERIQREKQIAESMGWKYYLPESEQTPEVRAELDKLTTDNSPLTTIKCIDPCCGSGHILVYLFDVLMQIYLSCGYTEHDAALSILQNNLYGLEIDRRAAQPHIYHIVQSNDISDGAIQYFCANRADLKAALLPVLDAMKDAEEYGSIITVPQVDFAALYARFDEIIDDIDFNRGEVLSKLLPLVQCAELLAQKYHVVVTNPPYMGSSGMGGRLSQYVKDNYPDSKSDLFAVFIEKGNNMVAPYGINCMVTMQSWMFLSSFEKMRTNILQNRTITNLMHMENMVIGIAFGTAVTCFRNATVHNYKGTYNQIKLCDIENDKPRTFPVQGNRFAQVSTDNFAKIPGSPVAYWVSDVF